MLLMAANRNIHGNAKMRVLVDTQHAHLCVTPAASAVLMFVAIKIRHPMTMVIF